MAEDQLATRHQRPADPPLCGPTRPYRGRTYALNARQSRAMHAGRRTSARQRAAIAGEQKYYVSNLPAGEVPVMVGLRLFLPESWTSDTVRLDHAGVPEDCRACRSKPDGPPSASTTWEANISPVNRSGSSASIDLPANANIISPTCGPIFGSDFCGNNVQGYGRQMKSHPLGDGFKLKQLPR